LTWSFIGSAVTNNLIKKVRFIANQSLICHRPLSFLPPFVTFLKSLTTTLPVDSTRMSPICHRPLSLVIVLSKGTCSEADRHTPIGLNAKNALKTIFFIIYSSKKTLMLSGSKYPLSLRVSYHLSQSSTIMSLICHRPLSLLNSSINIMFFKFFCSLQQFKTLNGNTESLTPSKA